jgi:hypothetical protein
MSPWEFSTLLLACCLVSGVVGWATASLRYQSLAGQVAEMEAAVSRYWDRVRKRMSIDIEPKPKPAPHEFTEQEIDELARKQGLRWPSSDA